MKKSKMNAMWKYVIYSYLLFWVIILVLGGLASMVFHAPPVVRELFWEYLTWANDMNDQSFGIRLDIATVLEEDMEGLEKFMPRYGRLLLAESNGFVAGCICLKKLSAKEGEVKRLYVRPAFRSKGIGKELVTRLLEEALEIGYQIIRLDSTKYMVEAHDLYRSFGFQEIEPYPESEIPGQFHAHWVFMELDLIRHLGNMQTQETMNI